MRRKPRREIPEDFTPTPETRQWCESKYPRVDVDKATESYVNKGGGTLGLLAADHQRGFRNWVKKADELDQDLKGKRPRPGAVSQTFARAPRKSE